MSQETIETKSIFKSKTAALALITTLAGLVAAFWPPAGQFVAEHSGAILIGLGVLSGILRLVTKGRVELFPALVVAFGLLLGSMTTPAVKSYETARLGVLPDIDFAKRGASESLRLG